MDALEILHQAEKRLDQEAKKRIFVEIQTELETHARIEEDDGEAKRVGRNG